MNPEDNRERLPFRDDFAVRVLLAADQAVVRRRNLQWAAAGVAASLVTAVMIVAPWRAVPSGAAVRQTTPVAETSLTADLTAFASTSDQTDPLAYMFPDAAPLSRFSRQYGDAQDGQDSGILAEDSEEADGS
ncbi:MAG TPA: hypothetical protein VGM17_06370 [Rhizomicrobium sp.]|jgi:hypothetical protein